MTEESMSEDLITRLRRVVTWQGVVPRGNGLAREAADEIERLRDWCQRVTDTVLDWRRKVTGTTGSGCPIDAVVILAARLRKSEAEIERLQSIINAKLHRRKCHDCGHVGWYADSRTPYCLCDQCLSQDTRLVKEAK